MGLSFRDEKIVYELKNTLSSKEKVPGAAVSK